jgi:hypothetical protein
VKPPRVRLVVDDSRVFVVHGGKTKHGRPRRWRELEFAQAALWTLYPDGPPWGVPQKELYRQVNAHLAADPDYVRQGFGPISLRTVLTARDRMATR